MLSLPKRLQYPFRVTETRRGPASPRREWFGGPQRRLRGCARSDGGAELGTAEAIGQPQPGA